MGSKSDFLEKKLLDHVLGNTPYTAPSNVYVGLFTASPDDTGGGTEVTGGSYIRKTVVNSTGNWPNATGSGSGASTKTNGAAITFVKATADWGTITSIGIYDDPTAGNLLYWGAVSPNKTVLNNDTAEFAASTITITEQ